MLASLGSNVSNEQLLQMAMALRLLARIAVMAPERRLRLELKMRGKASGVGKGHGPRNPRPKLPNPHLIDAWMLQGDKCMMGHTYLNCEQFKHYLAKTMRELERPREIRLHQPVPVGSNAGRPRLLSHSDAFGMTLVWLVEGQTLQNLGEYFGIHQAHETVYHTLQSFVLANHGELQFPSETEQKDMARDNPFPEFPEVFGELDGTSFETTRKAGQYSGHHHLFSRGAQFITDNTGKIIYLRACVDGSKSDTEQINAGGVLMTKLAPGMFIATDNGYPNAPGTLSSNKNWPSHLKNIFRAHRARIEHLFGRMKRHFRLLEQKWHAPGGLHLQALCVYACAILYNIAHKDGRFLRRTP